jgi:hypothetical protein
MACNITKEQRLRKRHVRQRNERRISIMHKAYEYGTICHADIFLGIRLKENGHNFTFQSDDLGFWSPMTAHLVRRSILLRYAFECSAYLGQCSSTSVRMYQIDRSKCMRLWDRTYVVYKSNKNIN